MTRPLEPAGQDLLLRRVVDSLDGRMCVISADGTILDTNRHWDDALRQQGWSGQEPNLFELITGLPEEFAGQLREGIEAVIREAAEGGGSYRAVKGSWPAPSGEQSFVVVRTHPIHGHSEARAVIIAVDITEELRTREELRRATDQARLMALVAQHTDSGVQISDGTGKLYWANEAFYQMSGYSPEEYDGPLGRTRVREALAESGDLERFIAELAAGRGVEAECRMLTRDGEPYWVNLEVQPVISQDGSARFVSLMRNTTKRRLAQEQLLAANREAVELAAAVQAEKALLGSVIETLPHLIYLKDNDLRYRGVNSAFLQRRALADGSEVLGRAESELPVSDPLTAALLAVEAGVLGTGRAVADLRVTMPQPDGPPAVLLLSVLPHRVPAAGGDGEEVLGLIGVGADVTHVTELERQLAQSSRLEAIGQLAAGMAHEINTPIQFVADNTRFIQDALTSILQVLNTVSELAGEQGQRGAEQVRAELGATIAKLDLEFVTEEVPAAITQSLEGLGRVTEIVRAMKDFSHPGRERTNADLNRAIESTVQVSRSEWKYVAELDLELDPEVGLVPCFEGELKQVVLNIIINAAQALQEQPGPGPGRIRVCTRREENLVRLEIGDNGPGMTEDVRQRVFDQFFTTKDVGKGTGQGLSIAYNVVVQKHQGTIDVESAPGQGTTFTITLPLRPPPPGG